MCGILYYFSGEADGDVSTKAFDAALLSLRHRGPDATGTHHQGGHHMGAHRLAVVHAGDVRAGDQPLRYPAGDVLVCNGQIYNAEELREALPDSPTLRTDVDVIGLSFERYESCAAMAGALDGDFAFVFMRRDVIYAARDAAGVRPLFYGSNDDGVVIAFASEMKALVRLPGVSKCHVFPPGFAYDSCSRSFTRYSAELLDDVDEVCRLDVHARLRELLTAAVQKRVGNSDVPVALLCSGGVDSSLLLAIAKKLFTEAGKGDLLHAFTVKYDSGASDDALYASLVARSLGVPLTTVQFSAEEVRRYLYPVSRQLETHDPNTIRAAVPMYLLARHIARETPYRVIVSGEGADELFAGYNYFVRCPGGGALNEETLRLTRNLHMFDLLRADRSMAAHGLELRVPFLDKALVNYVHRLPGRLKLPENGVEKALLREAFVQSSHESQVFPPELDRVLQRPKERFSDGCGFSYVPSLLRYLAPECCGDLGSRLEYEQWVYDNWFDARYPGQRHVIAARELPGWAAQPEQKGVLDSVVL